MVYIWYIYLNSGTANHLKYIQEEYSIGDNFINRVK